VGLYSSQYAENNSQYSENSWLKSFTYLSQRSIISRYR